MLFHLFFSLSLVYIVPDLSSQFMQIILRFMSYEPRIEKGFDLHFHIGYCEESFFLPSLLPFCPVCSDSVLIFCKFFPGFFS